MKCAQEVAKHALPNITLQAREPWPAAAQRLVLHFRAVGVDAKLPHTSEET